MKDYRFCKIQPKGNKLHLECNHFINTDGDKLSFGRIIVMTQSQRTKETFWCIQSARPLPRLHGLSVLMSPVIHQKHAWLLTWYTFM